MGNGLKTVEQLRKVAAEMQARKQPAKPVFTRKINAVHRAVGAMPLVVKKEPK